MIHELDGSTDFSLYGQRPGEVIYSVSRGGLNQVMLDAVDEVSPTAIEFHQELRAVHWGDRRVELVHAQSGHTKHVDFDVLIGADGSGSAVRAALIAHVGGRDETEFLDHDYKELNIPPRPDGTHAIDREALHIWPRGGYMLIALPNLDGSFTVTLFLPRRGPTSFEQLTTPASVRALFARQFPDALSLLPELEQDFFENPTGQMGTVRCWPWTYRDIGMLIGDAAHGIVPFHGQGMNCGFEDCSQFLHLLDRHRDDWTTAIAEFQAIRKPNADAVATMALENYIEMRDRVRDPKYHLKKEVGFALERMMPDRFIPRYSMVMFHRIPYQLALERGAVQEAILEELVARVERAGDVDYSQGRRLVEARLSLLAAAATPALAPSHSSRSTAADDQRA
jgi:kynurenine 3-monooxygenase